MNTAQTLLAALVLVVAPVAGSAQFPLPFVPPEPTPAWAKHVDARLATVDEALVGDLGVFVLDLASGESYSLRGDEPWYMASVVKIPVAVQVLRDIQDGMLSLDTRIELLPDDFVDGAGGTNMHPAGTRLRVDYLLEQMLVHSDNTASDVLIRTVGLARINALAHELVAGQGGRITTLADVRRYAYSGFHPDAARLQSADLLSIRQAGFGDPRVERLAQVLGVPRSEFKIHDLDAAFEAYYETELNAAPISAYGRMLGAIAEGDALDEAHTRWLLDMMGRVVTGERRVKAGLPQGTRFQHKTGTQHRRACDMGVVTWPTRPARQPVVIATCTRGVASLATSERAMRAVGEAVAASGVLERESPH